MARRRRQAPRDPHYWGQATSPIYCWLGGHYVTVGEWMRWRRGDVRRMASCENHLKASGIFRPNRPFTSSAEESIDVRTKRAGDAE